MNYSRDDVIDLVKFLDGFGNTYLFLKGFFAYVTLQLKTGLTEPPDSFSSASAVEELIRDYPDAYHALKMPEEDLPMYLDQKIGQEYPIACWRLKRVGLKQ